MCAWPQKKIMPDSTVAADFVFDHCAVRREARQVLIDGQPTRLGARAFDLLLVLIEHRDRVVSKNELLDLVWPGLVIEENNLQVHVSTLRKLLGPQTIATIPDFTSMRRHLRVPTSSIYKTGKRDKGCGEFAFTWD